MPRLSRSDREAIAKKRLVNILRSHGIATARTLEQKISDAGPNDQRIDPHVLTVVRNAMVRANQIRRLTYDNVPWFALPETPENVLAQRLHSQRQTLRELNRGDLSQRIGQTLEIATYRALLQLQTGTGTRPTIAL
jgi:hypothetical protein